MISICRAARQYRRGYTFLRWLLFLNRNSRNRGLPHDAAHARTAGCAWSPT